MSTPDALCDAVRGAITRRIIYSHVALIGQHGIEKVMDAIDLVAEGFYNSHLEEIGSSDVSCWVKDVERVLNYQEVS